MKLWHYTARHHIDGGGGHAGPGILRTGIQPNLHPYLDLRGGLVWLTESDEWAQSWSPRPIPGIDCDRTEARVEVAIPVTHPLLMRWAAARRFALTPQFVRDLEAFGDPEHWWVFNGRVQPGWLRRVQDRPVPAVTVSR